MWGYLDNKLSVFVNFFLLNLNRNNHHIEFWTLVQNTEKRLKSKTGDPWRMGSAPHISVNSSSSSSAPPFAPAAGISSKLLGDIRHQQHTQELQRISSHSFGGLVASGISSTRCSCSRGRCAELLLRAARCHRHTKASTTVRKRR